MKSLRGTRRHARARFAPLLTVLVLSGCKSEAARACLSEFASAQQVVMKVEAEDIISVNASVAALDTALSTCKAAEQGSEVEELTKAHAQVSAHRDRLMRREEMLRQRTEQSPEELQKLIKSGDPECPHGQAYLHGKSAQRIRCTGPQPIDMTAPQAEEYFRRRGYKVSPGASPLELRFEHGAELSIFRYEESRSTTPPRCVVLYPPPGMSWQEATARITGASPARLKADQPIRTRAGDQLVRVEESAGGVTLRIGDCNG